MDFLDPRAKKQRTIRLFIGYALVSILIFTASTIIVFNAYGFDVDRKTGEVIQNGLVYIDSAPDGAAIYLNGELNKSRTNARMTLQEGKYDLVIRKDGYRDWNRNFEVKGGSVIRLTYPMLILNNLESKEAANYGQAQPVLSTESPDRRWLMVSKGASLREYFVYDFNTLNQDTDIPSQESVIFPENLFKAPDGKTALELVEWSTDNRHLLVKYTYGSGSEFLVLDREVPGSSININQLLGQNPTAVNLRDKKFDQWYIFDQSSGLLQTANTEKTITPALQSVTAYKTHDSTVIMYAQVQASQQNIYVRQGSQTFLLRSVAVGPVHLDIARYDGTWYAVVASDGDKKSYVYKDPFSTLAQSKTQKAVPVTVFRANSAFSSVKFSTNTRFILVQSGQHFGVYDAEKSESYNYDIVEPIDADTKVTWMDGHRILFRSNSDAYIVDFDGSNKQKLVKALPGDTVFFDRDYTVLYSVSTSLDLPNSVALIQTNLRAESDR